MYRVIIEAEIKEGTWKYTAYAVNANTPKEAERLALEHHIAQTGQHNAISEPGRTYALDTNPYFNSMHDNEVREINSSWITL